MTYTQQKDPRDNKLIKEWTYRLAFHKCWDPETFLDPYVQSSDEESKFQEEENPPEVIIAY